MNINQTMHPKAIIIFKLISLEPNQFYSLDLFFLIMVIFPKLDFQAGRWQLGECRSRYSLRRQPTNPPINQRAPLRLSNKRCYLAIGTKSFFLNCTQHNYQRPFRNSFVVDCSHFIQYQVGFLATQKV